MIYARKNIYKIHPTKTSIVVLSNKNPDKDCRWSLGDNTVHLSDTAVHLGINRAGKKGIFNKCEGTHKLSQENLIFFNEYRTSWYNRTQPYDIIYHIQSIRTSTFVVWP